MDRFIFFVSPKGCISKREWRTGYYHIAKRLNAWIVPGGFDFEKKRFIHNDPFRIEDHHTYEYITAKTQDGLYHITPLYPESSEFPIDAHTRSHNTSIMTQERQLVFILGLLLLIILVMLLCSYIHKTRRRYR